MSEYDCGHLCCDERSDPHHDHFLASWQHCPPCAAYLAFTRRGPWRCPDTDFGCQDVPIRCTCPPHREDADEACGEDEAAGCHFCAHKDIYSPCPNALAVADA